MREFLVPRRDAEFSLYPYAKNLRYRADGMVSMTIEIFNGERSEEFSFGFMCSPPLMRFLNRTLGDEYEENEAE
jgi:hypothetical protein